MWQDRLPTEYGVSSKLSGVGCRGSRAVPAPYVPKYYIDYSLDIVLLLLCHLDRSGEISFSCVTKLQKIADITKRFPQINWHKCPQRSITFHNGFSSLFLLAKSQNISYLCRVKRIQIDKREQLTLKLKHSLSCRA